MNPQDIANVLPFNQLAGMLRAFVCARPGLEPGNYSDCASYRADSRKATEQRNDALTMLDRIALGEFWCHDPRESYARAMIHELSNGARLSLAFENGEFRIDYCAGQYWPLEYRAAVCRMLARAWWRIHSKDYHGTSMAQAARFAFSRGIVARYFS
jgi:hypothetical protein